MVGGFKLAIFKITCELRRPECKTRRWWILNGILPVVIDIGDSSGWSKDTRLWNSFNQ